MATEAEVRDALKEGERFKPAILDVVYNSDADELVFVTPWGDWKTSRRRVDVFRDIPWRLMQKLYTSHVGIHIDEIDLDVNSAGLLMELFPELSDRLVNSY